MEYINHCTSPIGKILLSSNGTELTGLWFEGQRYFPSYLKEESEEKNLPLFDVAKKWLDLYFDGKNPTIKVPLKLTGTPFQKEVWNILCDIPYGTTVTYGDIAKELATKRNLPRFSAQAVGGAVGHNNISIIVPCHRVVGANGSLTGYAGGIERKIYLLEREKAIENFEEKTESMI